MPEPGSNLDVRVELEGRIEQGVGPWTGSEAPGAQFSPQIHRASFEKYRHYCRVSQQLKNNGGIQDRVVRQGVFDRNM